MATIQDVRFLPRRMNEVVTASLSHPTLSERLRDKIRREGPITFREWMEAALYDPVGGYYRRTDRPRWGRGGDYRTSPERSPLFAATMARYFASLFKELGAPVPFHLIEAGAGDGSFARDVRAALQIDFPQVSAAHVYLIDEMSADSRQRIEGKSDLSAERQTFIQLAHLTQPLGEGIIFSHELIDAFPVHRVSWRGGKLWELYVAVDRAGDFVWHEATPSTPRLAAYLEREGIVLAEGQRAELNLAAAEWITSAASALTSGFVVTADYGAEAAELYHPMQRPDGTLRAFKQHRLVEDVLADPGDQDLTTTINWSHLCRMGELAGLRAVALERQDQFLLRIGMLEQLELMTSRANNEAEVSALRLAARDLILPGGAGHSFQVLVQRKGF